MTNLIATDAQSQEIDSGLVDLFEITLPDSTIIYLHPGVDDDFTNIQFRDKTSPTNPVTAGSFIVGNTYTIASVGNTSFTGIGAGNNNVGTSFVATGVGSGTGTATQTDNSIRTYTPMPMIIDGLELQADGAPNRPNFQIANIGSLLSGELSGYKNDDLVGQRIVRRRTLKKYLVGESADASPPVEFRSQEYIIDRLAKEDNISLTYEVAAPYDLEGIKLPRRVVVGKFCSWKYQGYHDTTNSVGGCTWKLDGSINYKTDAGTFSHNAYFDINDSPLVPTGTTYSEYNASTAYTTVDYVIQASGTTVTAGSFIRGRVYKISSAGNTNFTTIGAADSNTGTIFTATGSGTGTGTAAEQQIWLNIIAGTGNTPSSTSAFWKEVFQYTTHSTSSVAYLKNTLVLFGGTVWKALRNHTSSSDNTPSVGPGFWERADICGKTLQSCKCRFGFKPNDLTGASKKPDGSKNLAARLPFGSFPGTLKF